MVFVLFLTDFLKDICKHVESGDASTSTIKMLSDLAKIMKEKEKLKDLQTQGRRSSSSERTELLAATALGHTLSAVTGSHVTTQENPPQRRQSSLDEPLSGSSLDERVEMLRASGFGHGLLAATESQSPALSSTTGRTALSASQRRHALASGSLSSDTYQCRYSTDSNPGSLAYQTDTALAARPSGSHQLSSTQWPSTSYPSTDSHASPSERTLPSKDSYPDTYQHRSYGTDSNPGSLAYQTDIALAARPSGSHHLSSPQWPSSSYPPVDSLPSPSERTLPSKDSNPGTYQHRSYNTDSNPGSFAYQTNAALAARPSGSHQLCNTQWPSTSYPRADQHASPSERTLPSKDLYDSFTYTSTTHINSNTHQSVSKKHVVEYYQGQPPVHHPQPHTIPMLADRNTPVIPRTVSGHVTAPIQSNIVTAEPTMPEPTQNNLNPDLTPTQRDLLSDWNVINSATYQRGAIEERPRRSNTCLSSSVSRKRGHESVSSVSASMSDSSESEAGGKHMRLSEEVGLQMNFVPGKSVCNLEHPNLGRNVKIDF